MTEQVKPGLLIVLSGPSGVGKDAVLTGLRLLRPDLQIVVTATTRAMRPGELQGVSYHFRTEKQFQAMVDNNELLEWAMVHGRLYGTPVKQVREAICAGYDVLLKIDVQGASQIRQRVKEAVTIFLAPSSINELMARLSQRGTETDQERALRLANANLEMMQARYFDYLVYNRDGKVEDAVAQVDAIIEAEHCRVEPRRAII